MPQAQSLFIRREKPMAAVSWHDLLARAGSEQEVISVVRDFMATLEPRDIALLPPSCRPGKFHDASDVSDYAFEVVREYQASHASEMLRRLVGFFSAASSRMAQVGGSSNDGHDRSERTG